MFRCWCCGADNEIEVSVRAVQAELPLGPIEISQKKNLDVVQSRSLQSTSRIESASVEATKNESNRIESDELIEAVEQEVGPDDWIRCRKLWVWRATNQRKALRYAYEDLRMARQRQVIRNPGAYLTSAFTYAVARVNRENLPLPKMGGE